MGLEIVGLQMIAEGVIVSLGHPVFACLRPFSASGGGRGGGLLCQVGCNQASCSVVVDEFVRRNYVLIRARPELTGLRRVELAQRRRTNADAMW